jgi:hypothetical protein
MAKAAGMSISYLQGVWLRIVGQVQVQHVSDQPTLRSSLERDDISARMSHEGIGIFSDGLAMGKQRQRDQERYDRVAATH